jgi:hypothetical protein
MARTRWRITSGLAVALLALVGARALVGWSWFGSSNSATPSVQITEHVFQLNGSAGKQTGEDCTTYGQTDCLSGICFHYQADPTVGYVCTTRCGSNENCPPGWGCASVYPMPGETYCAPPSTWVPAVAPAPASPLAP